ncbi:MAG: hypothetical protein UW21_C0026G0005 [Candidatus Woesebacteria bacterium GW2011_GWB1_44_11b]|uniref:Uncharacterized protein n=1 Tax=Candidatus Woesebacteria bacterium GW2011_GWB1_44_11b TaxID=1618580 RepID=A0A0G1JAA4_9BACT|nr:MAG: hypothetical protein UW21_C0026G0005 [Candidatus Woesebacteria bacterium GW2011_GWB1_44_11b]
MSEPIKEDRQQLDYQPYYQKAAENLVNTYGLTFQDLLQRNPELPKLELIGDKLISAKETTGYNLIVDPKHMDVFSENRLLFFNIYGIDTPKAGLLISDLLEKRRISERQIKLGVKASKVIYDDWPISPNEIVERLYPNKPAGPDNPLVSKTLETVITFMPETGYKAKRIIRRIYDFLKWKYPDVRATISLETDLSKKRFTPVQANVLNEGSHQIIVLRRNKRFDNPWKVRPVMVNKELARYIVMYGVKP